MGEQTLVPFFFEGKPEQQVRVLIDHAGDPWFVASDVAGLLGYAEAKDLTRLLDDDEKGRQIVPTLGGPQEMIVISEPGLYKSIMRSRRPEAKVFDRWVRHEVLPQIRRTGSFGPQVTSVFHPPAQMTRAQLIAVDTRAFLETFAIYGLTGNQLLLAVNRQVRQTYDFDALAAANLELTAPRTDPVLTPTDLGKRLVPEQKPQAVNQLLTEAGLQTPFRDQKERLYYEPTDAATEYAVLLDTEKKNGQGTAIVQLKWRAGVLPLLQRHLDARLAAAA